MPSTPTPRIVAVQREDAGFYSMTLCWDGRPPRGIKLRLQTTVASLSDAKAAAADELLRLDPGVLAWLHRNAGPGAGCGEAGAAAERGRSSASA